MRTAPVEGVIGSERKGKTPVTKETMHPSEFNDRHKPRKQLIDFLDEIKLKTYYQRFVDNGYEFVQDLVGIEKEDLEQIEISERDRPILLEHIKSIPPLKTKHEMPENIRGWLKKHHLKNYESKISKEFKHLWELQKLKNKCEKKLEESAGKKFGIVKPGHFKRLLKAVYSLQVKGHEQMTVLCTERTLVDVAFVESGQNYPENEIDFWEKLLDKGFLSPHNAALASSPSAEENLRKLRTTTLWVFCVSNMLWMMLILTLVQKRDLKILGLDVIALSFLIIYGGIFVAQFVALLCHRVKTIMHILARTPWIVRKKGEPGKKEGKNEESVVQRRKYRRVHPYSQA